MTRSYRDAAKICGVSHNTVRSYVKARQEGAQAPVARQRGRMTDPFLPQMASWVEQSRGKIRGDVVHEKLLALGFTGCERTTRTTLAELKSKYRARSVRVHRPWTPEPGLWLQYDYGDGPVVDGVKTVLFVAWLAFSRLRIVIPLRDKTMPSVFAALDRSFRLIGGVPTYVLTDYVPRNIIGLLWPAGLCRQSRWPCGGGADFAFLVGVLWHITPGWGDRGYFNLSDEKGSCHVGGVFRSALHGRSAEALMDGRGDRDLR